MKRLYVKPEFRKYGYGRALVDEIIFQAKEKKYKYMVLDTLEELKDAIKMYEKYGFYHTEPYYENPLDTVIYMEKSLLNQ